MLNCAHIPVLGIAAYSGTGKTTLLIKLLALFKEHGLRVGIVKHAHHSFDIDIPGKDSYELRKAGATQLLVGSRQRLALIMETVAEEEPLLDDLLRHLDQDTLDLVLVEGFKTEIFPKIELHRPSLGHRLLCLDDKSIVAVASDAPLLEETNLPLLNLNQPDKIITFITALFPDLIKKEIRSPTKPYDLKSNWG